MAVQLPALCPLSCPGCRTIEFNRKGDIPGELDLIKSYLDLLESGDSLFITSTGEPGLTEGYKELVTDIVNRGVEVAVCCANKISLIPGMVRAEISRSQEQDKTSLFAIAEARKQGIPYVATVVNFGQYDHVSFEDLAEQLDNPDAIIIRKAQPEGAAKSLLAHDKQKHDRTRIWKKEGVYLGKIFPMACFHEFEDYRNGIPITCIDHMGQAVRWLGGEIIGEAPQKVITLVR